MRRLLLVFLTSAMYAAEGIPTSSATEIEERFRSSIQSLGYVVGPTTEAVIRRESKRLAETAAMMDGVTEHPTMRDGAKTGFFYATYKNGTTQRAGYFQNNVMVGPWIAYFDSGAIRWVGEYNDSGQKTGQHRTFYPNGIIEHIECYANDMIVGAKTTFYETGTPYIHQQWMDGAMNGLSTIYWPNGNVKKYSTWLNGKLHGKTITFDESGNTLETTYYENGLKKP